jgi:uracil phosphoribosyltransferase
MPAKAVQAFRVYPILPRSMSAITLGPIHVVRHPAAQICLTQLRDKNTCTADFRRALQRLACVLFIQATQDLETATTEVVTPLATTKGARLARPLVLVPILRAGLGMVDGILDLVPDATVAHVGIARDEETARPHSYYAKLPPLVADAEVIIVDPMLATGGSAIEAVRQLKAAGATRLRLLCTVSCPEGIEALHQHHPDVGIYTSVIDTGLNERSYIMPGLGDAGDRYFGT